jgi:hypothetical protein
MPQPTPAKKKKRGKPTLYAIHWTHPLTGKRAKLNIRHTRDYLVAGTDHIEVISAAHKQPNPISDTGYRSHFMDPLELINAGGPVSFVEAWLQRELHSKVWLKEETKRAQGDLFQWAAAQEEVIKRKRRPPGPSPTMPKPRITPRRRKPEPAP